MPKPKPKLKLTELEQVVEDQRELRGRGLRLRTVDEYLRSVSKYIEHAGRQPKHWTYTTVASWRDSMLQNDLAETTINTRLAAVKWASKKRARLSEGKKPDFAHLVEDVKRRSRPKVRYPLTEDEAARLLATCYPSYDLIARRDFAILTLGLRTGCRRSGIASASLDGYDGRNLLVELKGGAEHTIPNLDNETVYALNSWISSLNGEGIYRGAMFRSFTPRRTLKGPLTSGGVYRVVTERAKQAGLKVHPHILRHTFISWCRKHGVPDWRIRKITGQKSLGILDVYTEDQTERPVGDFLPRLR